LELADKDNEDTAAVMEVLSHFYASNSQLGPALYWGERFLKHCPKNVTALLIMGQANQLARNPTYALKYYEKAVEIQPDNEKGRLALAGALVMFNEPRKGLDQFQELRARGVKSQAVLLGLARCYRAVGQQEKA